MPDSKAVIEIKVNGDTIINADTEYIADSCSINGKDDWTQRLNVNGDIEVVITPSVKPLTIRERIKLFVWDFLCRFEKESEDV